jgi:hypothetical protein
MELIDRVRQVAGEAAEAAKKGASQVRSKVEQTQARKRADDAARRLGYLIYRERQEGAPAGPDADRLVGEIKAAEDELERMRAAEADQAATGDTAVTGPDAPPPAPEEATGE